jgi:predicted Zn-dependent protease
LYQQVIEQYQGRILPQSHPQHKLVQRVLDRLIPHSGLPAETNNWEVHVIKDEQKNAFVIPGGKVFVFSGILDICQGEQGLAAVLGHELAHVRMLKVQIQRAILAGFDRKGWDGVQDTISAVLNSICGLARCRSTIPISPQDPANCTFTSRM